MRRHCPAGVDDEICRKIRKGAIPYVAAEASGVLKREFDAWMRAGEADPDGPDGTFYRKVTQATAQARYRAELRVRKSLPHAWLKGAAKDSPGRPGWTDTLAHAGPEGGEITSGWLQILIQDPGVVQLANELVDLASALPGGSGHAPHQPALGGGEASSAALPESLRGSDPEE